MPKSPDEMAQAMIENLKANTGKALAQWLTVLKKTQLVKHGEITKHLKTEHGMTHGYASMIAMKYRQELEGGPVSEEDLVSAQYAGDKEKLLPIYEAILTAVKKFGSDVEVAPKKASVSLRRKKQFALIQPSTKTRIDLGIMLKGEEPTDRLLASKSSMTSHTVRITKKSEIDSQLKDWLKRAYEAAG